LDRPAVSALAWRKQAIPLLKTLSIPSTLS
jgi:hypothetical protein